MYVVRACFTVATASFVALLLDPLVGLFLVAIDESTGKLCIGLPACLPASRLVVLAEGTIQYLGLRLRLEIRLGRLNRKEKQSENRTESPNETYIVSR